MAGKAGMRMGAAIATSVAAWALSGTTLAADWEQIGPPGGSMVAVGVGLTQGELYAAATVDVPGQLVSTRAPTMACTGPVAASLPAARCPSGGRPKSGVRLTVTAPETIVADCVTPFVSKDGGRHWKLFSPHDVAGALSLDALESRRAAYRARWRFSTMTVDDALYVTDDGGATWTRRASDVLPDEVAFDPQHPGRMVAITTPFPPQGRDALRARVV